jgi:hypothetical protein
MNIRKEGRKEEACGAPEAVAPPPPCTSFPPSFINHNHHHQKPKRNNIRLLYIKKIREKSLLLLFDEMRCHVIIM